jgi:hypothetical protein
VTNNAGGYLCQLLKSRAFTLGLCAVLGHALHAQLDHTVLQQMPLPVPDSGKWNLSFEQLTYFKNNEYYSPINPGQTWFGMQLTPQVQYSPANNVLLSGGLMLQKEFGSLKALDKVQPLLNLQYLNGNWKLIAGSLLGHVNHNMSEPMYDFESSFYRRVEYGVQVIHKSDAWRWDSWIDWQRNIRREDPWQEQFTAAGNGSGRLLHAGNWCLWLPVQFTLFHRGGQINVGATPNISKLNTSTGLRLELFQGSLALESHLMHSFDFSPHPVQPWLNGHAWYTNAIVRWGKYYRATCTWWRGTEWQSPVGGPLFGGINNYDVYLNERVRELYMLRLQYVRALAPGFYIDVRLEPHYDRNLAKAELSHGLFMSYRGLIKR